MKYIAYYNSAAQVLLVMGNTEKSAIKAFILTYPTIPFSQIRCVPAPLGKGILLS